jgi:hypothetical protein
MRLSLRLLLLLQSAALAISLLAAPRGVSAQTSPALPQQWNDAVNQLADKIAADISPLNPLVLETKNISDLGHVEAASIQTALESELKNRSFRVVPQNSGVAEAQSAVQLQLTISQGAQGYVLVAEIQNTADPEGAPETAIVAAPKAAPGTDLQPDGSLSLDKRLIWQQPTKFLDFALLSPDAAGNPSLLAVLEPDRLAYYRVQQGTWRFIQAISIVPWQIRESRGRIDIDGAHVYVGDTTCSGELAYPDTMKCGQTGSGFNSSPMFIVGDQAGVGSPCKNREAYLETGTGDWTQTDSIQGYESNDGQFRASGAPIEAPGPVMSLEVGLPTNTVRAVVYNLKTKNYEAYLVTATCSH